MRKAHGPKGEMRADDTDVLNKSRHLRGQELESYLQLRGTCEEFDRDCDAAKSRALDRMGRVSLDANGGVSPGLRARIVDMIKAGLDDDLALTILDIVYLQNGLYGEYLGVCGAILEFEGHSRDLAVGSALVELAIHQLVDRLSAAQASRQERDALAGKCAKLLEGRARMLGMGIFAHDKEYDPLYRADLAAMDIYARRRPEPPGEIAHLLRGYSELRGFLGLALDRIPPVQKETDLAYYASVAINIKRETPFHGRQKAGPLDELESLLKSMKLRGLDARNGMYNAWRAGMCGKELLQRLLEMRLYLHLMPEDRDIELEPGIDGGKKADLRVHGLYIEAFAPHEAARTAFGRIVSKGYPGDIVGKILRKDQIDAFGDRHSMIIMEDPHNYVSDAGFQGRLADKIRPHAQLGGVMIARDAGANYECAFVKNATAASEITPEIEQAVTKALETPYC